MAFASGYSNFNNGIVYLIHDQPDDAINALSLAISAPDLPAQLLPTAHLLRAEAHGARKNYDFAIADDTAAIALKSNYVDAYLDRCLANDAAGKADRALADCGEAIRLQPENWRLYGIRSRLYEKLNRYDDELADFATFIAKRPGDIYLRLERAEVMRKAGRFSDAMTEVRAVQTTVPKDAAAAGELGLIYLSNNDLQNALASFTQFTEMLPKEGTGYFIKGQVEWALGRYKDSVASFRDSFDLDKSYRSSLLWLLMARARAGTSSESRRASQLSVGELSRWPGPLVALFLETVTPEEILAKYGPKSPNEHICTSQFYVGEWFAIHNRNAEAKPLLQAASGKDCADDDWRLQHYAAIDLARLQ